MALQTVVSKTVVSKTLFINFSEINFNVNSIKIRTLRVLISWTATRRSLCRSAALPCGLPSAPCCRVVCRVPRAAVFLCIYLMPTNGVSQWQQAKEGKGAAAKTMQIILSFLTSLPPKNPTPQIASRLNPRYFTGHHLVLIANALLAAVHATPHTRAPPAVCIHHIPHATHHMPHTTRHTRVHTSCMHTPHATRHTPHTRAPPAPPCACARSLLLSLSF